MNITVSITTRNRYYTTLPLSLMSIINQTLTPNEIILVDDNDKKEFYNIDIFKFLLNLMKLKNIKFSYYYGESKGQVYAQQIALENCETDWLFKMDDDNILNPDVLEILSNTIKDNTGAVSGLILTEKEINDEITQFGPIYNKIDEIYSHNNIQTCGIQDNNIKKCEHLYSGFLFNKNIMNSYSLEFSPAGHREDTVFTYNIFLKGYDLLVNPLSISYHLNNKIGGNNIYNFEYTKKNERLFLKKMIEWDIIPQKLEIVENGNNLIISRNKTKYFVY